MKGADAPAAAGAHPHPVPSPPYAAAAIRGHACRLGRHGWARRHLVGAEVRRLPPAHTGTGACHPVGEDAGADARCQ
ncbi:hypothetical protein GCM10010243_42100 [Streptomyces matensis]|nr:hypothetical protein GCM10010243_42100 [Streptomyces matensis]